MVIKLKTVTFSQKDDNGKKYGWDDGLSKAKDNMKKNSSDGSNKKTTDNSKSKQPYSTTESNPNPSVKKDPIQKKIDKVDKDIENINKERELRRKQRQLDRMSKSSKIKSTLSDPKFKKNAKIAGFTALGAGLATGAIISGIRLKRKFDEKLSNERIKESISKSDEENKE